MRQTLAAAFSTVTTTAQDIIVLLEKLAALFALLGGLGFRVWQRRRRRQRAEVHARTILSRAVLVLLEEANYRDWYTSTGRLVPMQEDPRIKQGEHRAKRQAVTDELRRVLGIPDRRIDYETRANFLQRGLPNRSTAASEEELPRR